MTTRIHTIAAVAATILLAACSGGGEGGSSGGTAITDSPPFTVLTPALPAPRPGDVALAPIRQDGRNLQVGTDVSPVQSLSPVSGRSGTSWGRVRDGVGRTDVVSYIEQILVHARWVPFYDNTPEAEGWRGLYKFPSPPTIHIAPGATPEQTQTVIRGVRLFNEALPPSWHIRIGPQAHPVAAGPNFGPPAGQIHVQFTPQETWPYYDPSEPRVAGRGGLRYYTPDGGNRVIYGTISIDPNETSGDDMLHVFGHELLHALGFENHITNFQSTLNIDWPDSWTHPIFPIDREALRAVYMRLEWGDDAQAVHSKLGDWSDTSTHLAGRAGAAAFGAAHRNGFVRPWATGPAPRTNLADSPLRGDVAWNGELLGFTPAGAPVAGDAAIGVDLSTLRGTASFESLETWTAGAPPGAPGTGAMWGDGDLDYAIAVRGNTFHRTSGDDGALTGIFVGAGHEGAAGTLERDDLSAGFGAARE